MNRLRGDNFTPRGKGRGRVWATADERSHYNVGAEPSSSDYRSGDRKGRYSSGNQMSWQRKTVSNQAQPVASEASIGQSCDLLSSRDNTSCVLNSEELNNREEIVGSDLTQAGESDLTPDNGHVNSIPREQSWPRNQNSKKHAQWKDVMDWKVVSPTSYKKAQPVASEASIGQSCDLLSSRDNTACVLNSEELNNREEIVGSDLTQAGESDLTPDNGHVNSIPREQSWPRNLNSKKHAQWKDVTDWKVVSPTSYKVTFNRYSDNFGIAKSIKGSADGPLESLKSSSSIEYGVHDRLSCAKDPESVGGSETFKCDSSQNSERAEIFDICPPKHGGQELKPSLSETNKEKRNQIERSLAPKACLLRNGMVLLKNYISISEQVKVVNECRKLGLGTGGFYQPGYRDGAKLSLRMMCLGKNWDPETRSYGDIRPIDGAKPPPIPSSFLDIVRRSVKESNTLVAEEHAILPPVTPDICLVNFYTTTGRLGLHQDRDESKASLDRGLPVVSISIGDNAEFLYGDVGEVGKAEKVTLESGDVLIFGGQSRLVFHGVSSIKSDTAPKSLLHMTNLRSGRLNLTFREY